MQVTGKIKWFDDKKGYGFAQADGKDYFVHYKEIQGTGFKTLIEGQSIKFDPADGVKGKVAKNIVSID